MSDNVWGWDVHGRPCCSLHPVPLTQPCPAGGNVLPYTSAAWALVTQPELALEPEAADLDHWAMAAPLGPLDLNGLLPAALASRRGVVYLSSGDMFRAGLNTGFALVVSVQL